MIVWTDFGFLIAVIGFACLFGMQSVMNFLMNDPTYYSTHAWTQMLAMMFAALLTWDLLIL